jgi:hypothetical protein
VTSQQRGRSPEVKEQLRLDSLLCEVSSRFVNLAPGDVDGEIADALRRVCDNLDIDFGLLWQWSNAVPRVIVPTHVYLRQAGPPPAAPVSQDQFPLLCVRDVSPGTAGQADRLQCAASIRLRSRAK